MGLRPVGHFLRQFREIVGASGTDVAREYGCTRQNISAIEHAEEANRYTVARYLVAVQHTEGWSKTGLPTAHEQDYVRNWSALVLDSWSTRRANRASKASPSPTSPEE